MPFLGNWRKLPNAVRSGKHPPSAASDGPDFWSTIPNYHQTWRQNFGDFRVSWTWPADCVEDRELGLVVIAEGRLDNQEGMETCESSARAILNGYRKYHRDVCMQLKGEFGFVIWDQKRSQLFCGRDRFGVQPIYYASLSGDFVFGTDARLVASYEGRAPSINREKIAEFITWDYGCEDISQTFFRDVHRLLPASHLEVHCNSTETVQYWKLQEQAELRFADDREATEAFMEHFTRAVTRRLQADTRHRVASMLSGGMDSSAIVAVASQRLRDSPTPFSVFSAIDDSSETGRAEGVAARAVVDHLSGLVHHTVSAEQFQQWIQFDAFARWSADPTYSGLVVAPLPAYAGARRSGVDVLLDGVDGDLVTSCGSQYIREIIKGGDYYGGLREAIAWSRNHDEHGWAGAAKLFMGSFAQAFMPPMVELWRKRLRQRNRTNLSTEELERFSWASAVNPEFARQMNLAERVAEQANRRSHSKNRTFQENCIAALQQPYLIDAMESYYAGASFFGIEGRRPFFDQDLIEFCLSVPAGFRVKSGQTKALLRRGMGDQLPPHVVARHNAEHVGPAFTRAWLGQVTGITGITGITGDPVSSLEPVTEFLLPEFVSSVVNNATSTGAESLDGIAAFQIHALNAWLRGPTPQHLEEISPG